MSPTASTVANRGDLLGMMLWGERTVKRQRRSVLERAGRGAGLEWVSRVLPPAREFATEPRF
jgi:hypothetical protein